MADRSPTPEICLRIAKVRLELHGPRGKAAFAKSLGISPSTYSYYEAGRVPPAEVLVRIADRSGVDLRWLLTGQASSPAVPSDHPAVRRIARLLADHPRTAEPLAAFVDLLAASMAWPDKQAAPAARPAGEPADPQRDWIPILGRSAAAVPAFWSEGDGDGVTALAELVRRHAGSAAREVTAAAAADDAGRPAGDAQIISLSAPDAEGASEFVVAGTLKRRCPDAFAVRIDGDSMAPDIRHGDVVICSASQGPAEGKAALVQLDGQIGVTCKIYRQSARAVHLVPINDQYPPQAFDAEQVVWARRVLARVRTE